MWVAFFHRNIGESYSVENPIIFQDRYKLLRVGIV